MGEVEKAGDRLAEWRVAVARAYLTGIVFIMPALLIAWTALRPPPRIDAAFYFMGLAWFSFLVVRVTAPPRVQAPLVVALLLAVGITGPFVLGMSPGPFLSSVSAVMLGGAIFGRRVALVLLGVATVWVSVVGVLIAFGLDHALRLEPTDPYVLANWVRLMIFFGLTTGFLLYVITGLFERMSDAWKATAAAAERERQQQLQRQRAEERAMEAQRLEAIGRLAGGVAHDFNNLLVIIMAWADMLPAATKDEERKEGLDAIRAASAQAAQLTRQLLSFAKKDVSQPAPVDVDAFVATTMKSLRRLLADDVKIEHVHTTVPQALADPSQLGQVLLNLAANAGDAMPRGGTLTIRTALVAPPDVPAEAPDLTASYVAISVSDTGVGMDEATRSRVFEPFFTTKGTGRGTGLGLPSVYGIVSQAGGYVRVESALGKGSTFTVAFPVAPQAAVAAAASASQPRTPVPVRHRILLVEDNSAVRATMAAALRNAGIEPIEATNADEALNVARRHREELELLCTDGVMPGLPTHVLIDGFRQLFPKAPVLLCSGYVEEELVRRGITEGTVAVLPKPFTAEALVTRVNELLASTSLSPQRRGEGEGQRTL